MTKPTNTRALATVVAAVPLAGCSTGSMLAYALFCRPEIPLALFGVVFIIWVVVKVSNR